MSKLISRVLAAFLLMPSLAGALTPTSTWTPTPTPQPPGGACAGDCDGSLMVAIDEIIQCTNIALGSSPVFSCPACDRDGDALVTIDELQLAVGAALAGCPTSDVFEPDDSPAQARRIQCGTSQQHAIVPSGDEDWMLLSLDRRHDVVLNTYGFQGGDPTMQLLSASLMQIDYSDDVVSAFPRIERRCGVNALEAGDYYIAMRGFAGYSVVPDYTIEVTCQPCEVPNPSPTPTPGPDAFEPDDTLEQAKPLECGEIQTRTSVGTAPYAYDLDWVTLTLTERATVHLAALAPYGSYLELYDVSAGPPGVFLWSGYGGLQRNCGIDALDPGTYALAVQGYGFERYYLMSVCEPCDIPNPTWTPTPTPTATPTPIPPDAAEEDDSRDRAMPIACGQGVIRSIAPAGDVDWFALEVQERSEVRVATYASYSTYLALQDASGRDLAYDGGFISRECGVNALEEGQYFIEVYPFLYNPAYNYDLVVICEPCSLPNPTLVVPPTRTPTPTPLPADRYEPDDGPEAAAEIDCGILQPRSLHSPVDQDWATFTLNSDSAVNLSTNPALNMSLFDANLTQSWVSYGNLSFTCQQPLAAGRYYVRVDCPYCGIAIPAYNLALLCGSCAGPQPSATPTATPSPSPTPPR
jgi:hypothetical protein